MKNKSADGLRGIAAFNVAMSHFIEAFLPTMAHKNYPAIFAENQHPSPIFDLLTSPFIAIFYNGHFAVLIFFVLSGYVLTLPYYTKVDSAKIALKKRLCGRYLRLNIPIVIAIFISYSIYRMGLYFNVQAAEIAGSVNWLDSYFPQGITVFNAAKEAIYESIFFGDSLLVPPLWTLKIEFIGSLYILLFYILKPHESTVIPLLMVLCLIYTLHLQDSIYYFAIFAGSLFSRFKKAVRQKFILFIIGFYFGAFQFNSVAYDFLPNLNWLGVDIWERKSFYNAVGAVLMTFAVTQGFGAKIFDGRLCQFLGRISFSLYLIHFTVVCSLSSFIYINFPHNKLFLGLNFVLYVMVCFVVAIVFEKVVDKRAISVSHRFSAKIFARTNNTQVDTSTNAGTR